MIRLLLLVFTASGIGLWLGCSESNVHSIRAATQRKEVADHDLELIGMVKNLVRIQARIEDVDRMARRKPTVNTLRPEHRTVTRYVDWEADPQHRDAPPPPREASERVVWWERPISKKGTRPVVGIAWDKSNVPKVFFADVLPDE